MDAFSMTVHPMADPQQTQNRICWMIATVLAFSIGKEKLVSA